MSGSVFQLLELSVHCVEVEEGVVASREYLCVNDLIHLLLGGAEFVLQVEQLSVFEVDEVFRLELLSDQVMASVSHFNLTKFDE